MSSRCADSGGGRYPSLDRTSVLRALVPARRREVVSILLDWPTPLDERALATALVAAEEDDPLADVSNEDAKYARVDLQQVHLPALSDAGLVAWDEVGAVVAPTNHPGLGDPMVRRLLAERSGEWDDVVDAIADRRRRTVAAVLEAAPGAMSAGALAGEIAAREEDPASDAEDVLLSLRHVHLPKLAEVGVIRYDRDDDTVAYEGHPLLDGPWFGYSSRDRTDNGAPPRAPEDPTDRGQD